MTIIRQAHTKQYVCLSNKLAQNNQLSLRARGLMAYLLSLPDNWEVHINHLVKELQEGRHVIRETLQELKEAGYVHHVKLGFKEGWQYFVFEEPQTEEQFKEFLRTIRFPNSSISEQFEDRPLINTNPSTNPLSEKNPPQSPPTGKKTQKEEDSSFRRKKEEIPRSKKVEEIAAKWTKEGRPQRVIDATVKAYFDQPLGSVKYVGKWMETVYSQKFECADADELYEVRRKFAEKMENECRNNYYFSKDKDVLCYTSGTTEKLYDIKGIKKGAEEFWQKHNLGKAAFVVWKAEQRSANGTCGV